MATTKTQTKAADTPKQVVDIADFFTKAQQDEGVWFEPTVEGFGVGFELKVIGSESNEGAKAFSEYDKDFAKIQAIEEDAVESNEQARVAISTCASKLVKDIRGKEGKEVVLHGKTVKYADIRWNDIFYQMPSMAQTILRFARKDTNFMKKKTK